MLVLRLSLELLLMMAVGFVVWRRGMVDNNFDKSLTNLVLNIFLPCLIINSFSNSATAKELNNCIVLLGLGAVMLALWFAVGQLVYIISGGGHWGRILRFGSMFSNFSFIGIPVVEALYGQQGVLYFVVFIVPIRMVYYSAAQPLLSPPGAQCKKKSLSENIKSWFSPPIVAVFVGLALCLANIELPVVLDKTINAIGSMCSPMGMILSGISLGKSNLKSLMRLRYLRLPLLRNLVMPAITLGIMYFLPVDPLVAKTVVIYAALPVASLLAAFTIQYDPDPQACLESAGSVFLSIMFFTVTIPLWSYLCEALL